MILFVLRDKLRMINVTHVISFFYTMENERIAITRAYPRRRTLRLLNLRLGDKGLPLAMVKIWGEKNKKRGLRAALFVKPERL